jgi:hypothetical protein
MAALRPDRPNIDALRSLIADGMTYHDIALEFRVTRNTVAGWMYRLGLAGTRGAYRKRDDRDPRIIAEEKRQRRNEYMRERRVKGLELSRSQRRAREMAKAGAHPEMAVVKHYAPQPVLFGLGTRPSAATLMATPGPVGEKPYQPSRLLATW